MRQVRLLPAMLLTIATLAAACSSNTASAPNQETTTSQLFNAPSPVDQSSTSTAITIKDTTTSTESENDTTTTSEQTPSTTAKPPEVTAQSTTTTEAESTTTTASNIDISPASVSFPSSVTSSTPFTVSGPRCGDLVRIVLLDPEGEPAFDSGRLEVTATGWSVSPSLDASTGTSFELRVVCDIGDRSTLNLAETITIS